jgi:hypothetical protein
MNNKTRSTLPVSSGLIFIPVIQEKNMKGKSKKHLTITSRPTGNMRFLVSAPGLFPGG